jgi:ArsR family transcriptional regulator, zinc-responsive transcriptional repressor
MQAVGAGKGPGLEAHMASDDCTAVMDAKSLRQAAEYLRSLAHPLRLRMIQMILRRAYTVGELATACGIPSHIASGHLRLMQQSGVLARRRDGRRIYYQAVEPSLPGIINWIETYFVKPSAPAYGCTEGNRGKEVSP